MTCNEILNKNHKCEDANIRSVTYVESLTNCPECKIPVEKIMGCDNATCPICKTNFSFRTGLPTTAGNHDKLTIKLKTSVPLLSTADTEYTDLFEKISLKKPKMFINISKDLNVAKQYEKMVLNKQKCIFYGLCIKSIYEKFNNNELTKDFLEKVLKDLNN